MPKTGRNPGIGGVALSPAFSKRVTHSGTFPQAGKDAGGRSRGGTAASAGLRGLRSAPCASARWRRVVSALALGVGETEKHRKDNRV